MFALVWAATSVVTAWEQAKFAHRGVGGFPASSFEEPSQTFLALVALNTASWACGTAALVVMAGTILRPHPARMTPDPSPRSG